MGDNAEYGGSKGKLKIESFGIEKPAGLPMDIWQEIVGWACCISLVSHTPPEKGKENAAAFLVSICDVLKRHADNERRMWEMLSV